MRNLISLALLGRSDQSPELLADDLTFRLLAECRAGVPPVPLRLLLKALSAKLEIVPQAKSERASEALLLRSTSGTSRYVVRCHDADHQRNWRRLRFTIAHEIAHILLLEEAARRRRSMALAKVVETPTGLNQLERVCDLAAAALLMPHNALMGLHPTAITGDLLWELYDGFLVSWRALISRIAQVVYRGSVIVLRRYARRPDEARTYRVDWCFPTYRQAPQTWMPRGCSLKHFSENVSAFAGSDALRTDLGMITLRLRGRPSEVRAIAVKLRPRNHDQLRLPQFEGKPIADEGVSEQVLLFIRPRESN